MKQRSLTKDKQQELFHIFGTPFDISSQKITKLFAKFRKTGTAYYPDDLIIIGPNDSPFVKERTVTTVGIYIANKFIFEDMKIFGYINKTLTGKVLGTINKHIASALLEEDITIDQVYDFIDRCQWLFGGTLAHVINTSLSSTILNLPQPSKKLRSELFEQHKEALKNGDPRISSDVETKICDDALARMREKNDPAMALFDSGCGIDPYNNYKTMFIMKGAVTDNTGESKTGYKTITSNYDTGISKSDMPKTADNVVTGAYARGVATQDGGYSAKKYNSMFQRASLGPRGSDCGTTDVEEVLMTESVAEELGGRYRFIMENGKPVMLTPKTVGKYVGKTVKLRNPGHCKYKEPCFCNVCYGDLPYRLDMTSIGLQLNIAAGAMLNASMKKFHDVRVKLYQVDIEKDLLRYKPW